MRVVRAAARTRARRSTRSSRRTRTGSTTTRCFARSRIASTGRIGKRGRRTSRSAMPPRLRARAASWPIRSRCTSIWQFVAHRQWSEMRAYAASHGAFLGGDLAFSPRRDSAEVWANQIEFDLTRTVGAPPDGFNPKGQRWGLPLPNWNQMRAEGFKLLRRARASCQLALRFAPNRSRGRDFFGRLISVRIRMRREISRRGTKTNSVAGRRGDRRNQAGGGRGGTDRGRPRHRAAVGARFAHALGMPGYKVMQWEREWGARDERFLRPAAYPELSTRDHRDPRH